MTATVDAVMLEARAGALATRSIKAGAKVAGIRLAIACMDLTTLEGKDSEGRIRSLCARAIRPAPHLETPSVAAVCVYPSLVRVAKDALRGSSVKVASVATAFPSGLSSLDVRLQDVKAAIGDGADEIDMVIDRGAFLAGKRDRVYDEIVAVKAACGPAVHLKVILETGELVTYDNVRRASDLALEAGADVIKTSTGKVGTNATFPVAVAMCEAIRDYRRRTGRRVGLKVAGGVRTTKQALTYLVIVKETLGEAWLTPEYFRIGASSLLDDLLMQYEKAETGSYAGPDYFPKD
ncbi:MAG: deoxyribose-phosphate aldolase [Candidatus Eremiobacteraeota bacterium]|nr:deoxyribose-phosphate aldolase [Candidatus Eremiobacteraeota bacterium]